MRVWRRFADMILRDQARQSTGLLAVVVHTSETTKGRRVILAMAIDQGLVVLTEIDAKPAMDDVMSRLGERGRSAHVVFGAHSHGQGIFRKSGYRFSV
jgi:hypothetical protein